MVRVYGAPCSGPWSTGSAYSVKGATNRYPGSQLSSHGMVMLRRGGARSGRLLYVLSATTICKRVMPRKSKTVVKEALFFDAAALFQVYSTPRTWGMKRNVKHVYVTKSRCRH
jgi:hypothetical protein